MKRVRLVVLVAAFAVAPACARAAERVSLSYTVTPDASAQAFHVVVAVSGARDEAAVLRMPSWQPASYALQSYAGAVTNVRATDGSGVTLAVTSADASAWRVAAGSRDFSFAYDVDVSDRQKLYSKSYVSPSAGALQAGATLVYLPDHRSAPVRLTLDLPDAWSVASPLGDGRTITARDYDELVDSPALFGDLVRADFRVRGIPMSAVYDARLGFDRDALADRLATFAELEIGMFGGAPFDRYEFLYLLTPDPSGNGDDSLAVGIEHARSTLITIDPLLSAAPVAFHDVVDETSAHELFHAWNVKAIHPRSLHRPDYAVAPRVRSLWLLEGVTSYYADRIVAAASANREAAETQLRAELAADVAPSASTPSLEQIGLDVATAGLETMLPLYVRGAGMGLLLDLEIRTETENRASLDDVLRALYERSDRGTTPYDEDDLARVLSHVAGRDMSAFLRRFVAGSEPPPVDRILGAAGWHVSAAPASGRPGATVRALVADPRATTLQRRIQSSILRADDGQKRRRAATGVAARLSSTADAVSLGR